MMDMFKGPPLNADCYDDISAVTRALVTELAADDTYQKMFDLTADPRVKEVVLEILKDEQNHQGRLLALLVELRGGERGEFALNLNAGLQGKERED
jgi:rubrerythrin